MGAANTTAAQFVVKYVAHPTYDPAEREATISDNPAFSDDQVAARFMTRHGGSVVSVARVREPLGGASAQYQDGQTVRLPLGWYMEFETSWDSETGVPNAYVFSPKGPNQDSASLNWARHEGTTSGDYVHDIPDQVHAFIMREEFDEYA
jgi:hypothetical protein